MAVGPIRILVIVVSFLVVAVFQVNHRPSMRVDRSVAFDLENIAVDAWDRFLDTFEARTDCIGDVTVSAVDGLDQQGGYRAADRTIEVRVPIYESTAGNTILHELGHHLEQQCSDQASVRPDFLAAQGLAVDTPWFEGDRWETTPSEMWAEAVSRLVSGSQQRQNLVPITDDALEIMERWAAGG